MAFEPPLLVDAVDLRRFWDAPSPEGPAPPAAAPAAPTPWPRGERRAAAAALRRGQAVAVPRVEATQRGALSAERPKAP